MRQDNSSGQLLCYEILKMLRDSVPQHIKDILAPQKYLGVPSNAQLDSTEGKEKILKKLTQRIGLVSAKADSITEAKIAHNIYDGLSGYDVLPNLYPILSPRMCWY